MLILHAGVLPHIQVLFTMALQYIGGVGVLLSDASAESAAALIFKCCLPYNYRGVLPMREQFYRHFEVLLMSIEL